MAQAGYLFEELAASERRHGRLHQCSSFEARLEKVVAALLGTLIKTEEADTQGS